MLKTCVAERRNGCAQQICAAAEAELATFLYNATKKAEKAVTLALKQSHPHSQMVNRISEFIRPDNQGYRGRACVLEWIQSLVLLKRSHPGLGIKWNIFYYDGSQTALHKLLTQFYLEIPISAGQMTADSIRNAGQTNPHQKVIKQLMLQPPNREHSSIFEGFSS